MNLENIKQTATDMKEFIYIIYGLAKETPGDILETGVRHGQTTKTFLKALEGTERTLYSIDVKKPNLPDHKNWKFIHGSSLEPHEIIFKKKFSIVFLDADHSYEAVKKEFELYMPQCTRYLMIHDITLHKFKNEVGKFWKELNSGITLSLNQWGLGIVRKNNS